MDLTPSVPADTSSTADVTPPSTPPSTLSPDDFAASIKAQYPQYKDVDNLTLAKAIVEKYPVYASKVDLTPPQTNDEPAPAEAYQSANPFGAVTPPVRTPETPPNADQQAAGDEFKKEQQARITARQPLMVEAANKGYGVDENAIQKVAAEQGVTLKPLLSTPEQYAEEKTGIERKVSIPFTDTKLPDAIGKPIIGIGDALTALQNVTTTPLVSLIRGTTQSQELGKQEQQTESNLDTDKLVTDAKAKQDAGQPLTADESKAVAADQFSSKIKSAYENLKSNPGPAAKELLLGALEDAPTYILASEVGAGVLDAASAIIKTGSQAERLAAIAEKAQQAIPKARSVGGVQGVDAAVDATKVADQATQDANTAAAVATTKDALVKPSLASTVGRETGVNAVAAPVAGEVQQSETGGKYDAAQLAQDLVSGSVLAAGGSLFKALNDARPLTSDEFTELQKAVNVAGLEDHPAVKELLPTLMDQARNPNFTDNGGKITPSTDRPVLSEQDARAAYGADHVPEGAGPQEIPGKTTVASSSAAPEITLFGGADPSTVKEEVSHFMQTLVQRRAAQGDPKFADLQNKIDTWEAAVRNHADEINKTAPAEERVTLPKGDELFAQAYVAHRGFANQAHPDVARVAIPDNILTEFDKLMGQYKDLGHEPPTRDITGLDEEGKPMIGVHTTETEPAAHEPPVNPDLEIPARSPSAEAAAAVFDKSRGRAPLPSETPPVPKSIRLPTEDGLLPRTQSRPPLPDLNAEQTKKEEAAFKSLPESQQRATPSALAPPSVRSARTAARVQRVLAHADRLTADPLAKEFLPERLQNLTASRAASPTMRAEFEDVRQANLDVARQMKAEPEKYFVPGEYADAPVRSFSTTTRAGKFGPQEEPEAPIVSATDRASKRLDEGLAKESAAQPDFTVRKSGETVPNPSRLPSLERIKRTSADEVRERRLNAKYGDDSPYVRYQLRPVNGFKKAVRTVEAKPDDRAPVVSAERPKPPPTDITPPREGETPEELGKRRAEEIKPVITGTIDEIKHFHPDNLGTKGTPGNETHAEAKGGALTKFMRYTDSADVLAALAGGKDGVFHTYMWTNPAKGDSYGIGVRRAAQVPLDQHFKDAKMNEYATIAWRRSPVKVALENGKPLTVTRAALVDLYNSAANTGTRRLMLKNGIIQKGLKGGDPIHVTEKDLHTLFDAMSPFDRKTANLMLEINRDKIKPELSRVSMIKDGSDHFQVENHWPRTVDRDQVQHEIKDMRDVYGQRQLEDEGFTQLREEHEHPIIFGDALSKFDNYLHKAAKYIGLAIPVRDALMVLGHPDVGKALLSSMGPRFRNNMMKYLNDISAMNPPNKSPFDKVFQFLSRNAAIEALGYRPTTILKTYLGSALNMTTQMSAHENAAFGKNHAWVIAHPQEAAKIFNEEIAPHSPYTADRYDPRQTQRILGYLGEADNLASNKAVQLYKEVQDVSIKPHNLVERQSAIAHWRMQNELHPDRSPADKAWELEKAIRRSQNTVSQLDMSEFGRDVSKNNWMKLGFMFTSPVQKARDLLRMGLMDFQRSGKTSQDYAKFVSTYAAVTAAMIAVPAALRPLTTAIYNGFQPPKKEKTAGDYIAESLIDAADLAQPIAGQTFRSMYEYWKNPSAHSLAQSNVVSKYILDDFAGGILDAAREVNKKGWSGADAEKMKKAYEKIITGASGVAGVPGVDVSIGYGGGIAKAVEATGSPELHAPPSQAVKTPQRFIDGNPKAPKDIQLSDADYKTLMSAHTAALEAIKSLRSETDFKKLSPEKQKSMEKATYNRIVAPVRSRVTAEAASRLK